MNPPPLHRYRFGTAEFDDARFELRIGGLLVDLQRQPLQLLALLLATPGKLVGRERIFTAQWNDRATGDAVLANAASKLRAAPGPDNAGHVVTVPRQGLRFEGELDRVAVGRRLEGALKRAPGMPVPERAAHRLVRALGAAARHETWLAEPPHSGDRRVFRFALDGERLAELKREVTLLRVLREALGERDDLWCPIDRQFDHAPYWLESAWAGPHLAALPQPARLGIALQVADALADALAAAHGAAVLHQDLKPANVLIEPQRGAAAGTSPCTCA